MSDEEMGCVDNRGVAIGAPSMLSPEPERLSPITPAHHDHGLTFRTFRNSDPPSFVQIWNGCQLGRGAVQPLRAIEFDACVLAKLYFDREGLLIACQEGTPVGFVHAGFGANEEESRLSRDWGVISAIMVLPQWRRQGIGRALLQRAQAYLQQRGAGVIYAGGMRPVNPFYLGLYGGAELPGFLMSDASAHPFLLACGYREADRCLVFQKDLSERRAITDWRFSRLRRSLEVVVSSGRAGSSWWWWSLMGMFETWKVQLTRREDDGSVAEVTCWEMASFARSWGVRSVGLVDVSVEESYRRRGVGKLLLSEVCARLRDEGVKRIEVQTMQRNQAALGLYRSLGFEQVDQGIIYRRE